MTTDTTPVPLLTAVELDHLQSDMDNGYLLHTRDPLTSQLLAAARAGLSQQALVDAAQDALADIRNESVKCLAIDADFDVGWLLARCTAALRDTNGANDV